MKLAPLKRWPCVINILPVEGVRIRCEKVYESVCPSCLENMIKYSSVEDLKHMAGQEFDPLLAWKANKRLKWG